MTYGHTLNAFVAGFQVRLELLETRPRAFELCVRDTNLTDSLAGTASVGDQKDVAEAADVAHVDLDTSPDLQSSVQRLSHDDHLALGTLGTEHLRVAVVAAVHTCRIPAHPDMISRKWTAGSSRQMPIFLFLEIKCTSTVIRADIFSALITRCRRGTQRKFMSEGQIVFYAYLV